MVPLLLRDLARAGTVTCAMAHAAGALHALSGRVDGSAAATRRFRRAQPRPPRETNPRPPANFPNATIPSMTRLFGVPASKNAYLGLLSVRNSYNVMVIQDGRVHG